MKLKTKQDLKLRDGICWDGSNIDEVADFFSEMDFSKQRYEMRFEWNYVLIKNLTGEIKVSIGHWIIKKPNGEYFTCSPKDFNKLYKPA